MAMKIKRRPCQRILPLVFLMGLLFSTSPLLATSERKIERRHAALRGR